MCVYGHLDVQPALLSDGWDTEPFELTEIDGKLFGRGATDDKGPALSWLWLVEAYNELKMELPVNVKIIYEGMEEYGSEVRSERGPKATTEQRQWEHRNPHTLVPLFETHALTNQHCNSSPINPTLFAIRFAHHRECMRP